MLPYKHLILILIGILGVWLLYWDIVAFATQGLNTGVWDITIIQAGLPSIVAGILLILFVAYMYGIRVIK